MSDVSSLCLPPVSTAKGRFQLPGSKSISNRVLLLAALAEGETRLEGLLDSDDTRVMLSALQPSVAGMPYPHYPETDQPA